MRDADWKTRHILMPERLRKKMFGFATDEDGSLIIFSLFLILGMLIIGGLGVDLMRYEAQRTRVQATTDRAVLAAAHPAQTPGSVEARKDVVMSYFTSAGLGNYISRDDIDVQASGTASEVKAQAKVHVDPLLLQLIGSTGFEAIGQGAAAQSAGLSEVSLVVDVSGSMGETSSTGNSKIYELKQAAKQFVNILLCNPNKPEQTTDCIMPQNTTSVSLIPYERQVVVGANILKKFNRRDAHDGSYCATFYPDEFTTTAFNANLDIRQTGRFDGSDSSYYEYARSSQYPCKTDSWREILPLSTSHTELGTKIDSLQANGATSIDIGLKWGVTMLDPSIRSVVDGLVAQNDATTSSGKVVNPVFLGRPLDYGTANTQKVVVLMTDGENTSQPYLYDEYRSGPSRVWWPQSGDDSRMTIFYENDPNTSADDQWFWPFMYNDSVWPYNGQFMDHPYGQNDNASFCRDRRYWGCNSWDKEHGPAVQMDWQQVWQVKRWGWWMKMYKTPNSSAKNDAPGVWINRYGTYERGYYTDYSDNKDKRLLNLCSAAKTAGIRIYTIELETESGGSGANVLKSCSSGDGYYFKVEGVDLVTTFSTIGQDIARLRLTE